MLDVLVPSMAPSIFHTDPHKILRLRYNYPHFIGRETGSERMSFAQGIQLVMEPGLIALSGHQRLALTLYHYKPLNRYNTTSDSMQRDDKARMVKKTSAQQ